MKILLINKFYYPRGGDCVYTLELEKLLKAKGHDVAIFSMNHKKNKGSEFQRYWASAVDYSKNEMGKVIKTVTRPIYSREVVKKFNRLLDEFEPDVVHANNIHSQISPKVLELASKRGVPVVWTLHDYKLICPAYTCFNNGRVCELCFIKKKYVLLNKCIKNNLLASLVGYVEAKVWNNKRLEAMSDVFIAPSRFLKQKMILGGYSRKKIKILQNFIPSDMLNNRNNKREEYFCYVGRLSSEKGIETLLKVIKSEKYHLKIVGTGSLEKSLSKEYSCESIEFLGFKGREEVFEVISKAQAMVVPSEWYENNPLSIIEALVLGTPVIASNIGGIPELISDNKNGVLFESKNVDDLRTKLHYFSEKLVKDIDNKKIAEEAIARYNQETYFENLMEIYDRLSVNNNHLTEDAINVR